MEAGRFVIHNFNGKDLFLTTLDEESRFALMSWCEIPAGMHQYLVAGRHLEITRGNNRGAPVSCVAAGNYIFRYADTVVFTLGEFEGESALSWTWKEYVIESESGITALPEYNIPHALRPYLKNGRKVEIGEDGSFKIPGLSARKPGIYTVMSWSGHDGLLETSKGDFALVSSRELSPELHGCLVPGRQVEINADGLVVRTLDDKWRHASVLAEIAALESVKENAHIDYATKRLTELRLELSDFEPADPTAITLEQKRANASI